MPVDEVLSRLFGFTFGADRFRWVRLPQGWKWSSPLFGERVAEILWDIIAPQYSDDVLGGGTTPEQLHDVAIEIFDRFDHFGVKVNFDKVEWMATEIVFLGYLIKDGKVGLQHFIKQKMKEIGEVRTVKDLERVIGILEYTRRTVRDVEIILGPPREDLKRLKAGEEVDVAEMNQHVEMAFSQALDNAEWLMLPGGESDSFAFVLNTDWANNHVGYMLFACQGNERRLVDLGSKKWPRVSSSYLGELGAMQWACKRTKPYRGDLPVVIQTDSHSLVNKAQSGTVYDTDVRAYNRWAWMIANEPGFQLEFIAGVENEGADLLSRPIRNLTEVDFSESRTRGTVLTGVANPKEFADDVSECETITDEDIFHSLGIEEFRGSAEITEESREAAQQLQDWLGRELELRAATMGSH